MPVEPSVIRDGEEWLLASLARKRVGMTMAQWRRLVMPAISSGFLPMDSDGRLSLPMVHAYRTRILDNQETSRAVLDPLYGLEAVRFCGFSRLETFRRFCRDQGVVFGFDKRGYPCHSSGSLADACVKFWMRVCSFPGEEPLVGNKRLPPRWDFCPEPARIKIRYTPKTTILKWCKALPEDLDLVSRKAILGDDDV